MRRSVFAGIPRNRTHNGGRIAFGPDGLLYVTTGDAQIRDAAQDPDALGGKILRLTPEGDPAPGNPFGNAVWTLGHRNVQGIAWTARRRDVGERVRPGHVGRAQSHRRRGELRLALGRGRGGRWAVLGPVVAWPTSEASPSGIAAVGDTVFVTGLRGERLWVVDVSVSSTLERDATVGLDGQGRLRDVVAAPDGTLWILTNNTDGRGTPRTGDDVLIRLPIAPAA